MLRSGSRYGGGEPVRTSCEAEPRPRGRPALERGGTSPEGVSIPRLRRSLVSAVLRLSSEAEFRPKVAGADYSGGALGPLGPWAPAAGLWSSWACIIVVGSFVFVICKRKWGSPGCLGDPYGCPRHYVSIFACCSALCIIENHMLSCVDLIHALPTRGREVPNSCFQGEFCIKGRIIGRIAFVQGELAFRHFGALFHLNFSCALLSMVSRPFASP
jgi:hypothetical protein